MNRSFLIIGLVAGSMMATSCGDNKSQAPNPANALVPVNLYEVHPEMVVYYDQYPGTVVAMNQVELRAQTEGYITGIFFKEGEHVRKGQKLYEIDRSKYLATNSANEANVKVAETNLDQAQKDADRYTYLNEHDAVAKQTLDHAMSALQNAKNQLAAAKQNLIKTQTDLKYAVITAPFDGTIGISQVKIGNTVAIGQTVLNTISSEGPTAVDIVVNEKQIPRFIKLQHKAEQGDSLFTLLMPDNTLYPAPGQIFAIDRGVNPQTGTITVRLSFPNQESLLRAGMSCKVRVRNQDTAAQMVIPGKAVVEQMGEYFVYVEKDTVINGPTDTGANHKDAATPHASQRKVILGQQVGDKIVVKKGLEDGDKVIVDGVQKLHDGSALKVQPPGQAPANAGH